LIDVLDESESWTRFHYVDRLSGAVETALTAAVDGEGNFADVRADVSRFIPVKPLPKWVRLQVREQFVERCVDDPSLRLELLEALRAPLDRLFSRAGLPVVKETGNAFIEVMPHHFERDEFVALTTQDGTGVVAPFNQSETQMDPRRVHEAVWRTKGIEWLIKKAAKMLKKGQPGVALLIGRELWATGTRKRRAIAAPILEQAYLALGRPSLAKVVQADRAWPDREWTDVASVVE
jgi:hypothetical protein